MIFTVPTRLAHYSPWLLVPLISIHVLAMDIRDRHWALNAAAWTAMVLLFICGILSYAHARVAERCRDCKPKPADRLHRIHYRAVVAYSRRSPIPLGTLLVAYLLTDRLIWGDPLQDGSTFNWQRDAMKATIALAYVALLSALRFDRINYPNHPRSSLLSDFLRHRAAGLVHQGHWLYVASLVPIAASSFLPTDGLWAVVGPLALVFMVAALLLNNLHGISLCEECVTQFPTNAPEYAEQHAWRFKTVHNYSIKAIGCVLLILTVTSIVAPRLWSAIISTGVLAGAGFMALMIRFHNTYQPWCPYCRHGRGGGEREEVPDPTGDHGRPVPVA